MMMYKFVVVALLCVKISSGLECPSDGTSAFKFSITNRRNASGYWTSKVQTLIDHDAEKEKEAGQWDVEVDHRRAKKCGHSESFQIGFTITVPPIKEKRILCRCPPGPGYELVAGLGYYKFHTVHKNWQEATEVCAQEGTHMIILNSEAEAKAMDSMIEKRGTGGGYHWVGFHDRYTEGKYVTIFNETLESTGYRNWKTNEPNGGVRENCGSYFLESGLNDDGCGWSHHFICEAPLYETK